MLLKKKLSTPEPNYRNADFASTTRQTHDEPHKLHRIKCNQSGTKLYLMKASEPDEIGVRSCHVYQSASVNFEQLSNSLSNHWGRLVTLQNRDRWGTPRQIEINKREITERKASMIDIQAGVVPHLEADRFAVNLDALAVQHCHLSGQE
jgi:hypothetical protein